MSKELLLHRESKELMIWRPLKNKLSGYFFKLYSQKKTFKGQTSMVYGIPHLKLEGLFEDKLHETVFSSERAKGSMERWLFLCILSCMLEHFVCVCVRFILFLFIYLYIVFETGVWRKI